MQIRDLTIGYPGKALLKGISFDIAPGECILLAGPNGSGKTTLLRTLAGAIPPLHGSVPPVPGLAPGTVSPLPGSVPPFPGAASGAVSCISADAPRIVLLPTGIPKVKGFTVRGFIRTACYRESGWSGTLPPEAEQRMTEALDMLGIADLTNRDISVLSDGQFQLACIASALTRRADVLLLDEPTGFLDADNRVLLLTTLRDLCRRTGLSVLFSSHDLHASLQVADRVFACTADGRFLASGPSGLSGPSSVDALTVLRAAFPAVEWN